MINYCNSIFYVSVSIFSILVFRYRVLSENCYVKLSKYWEYFHQYWVFDYLIVWSIEYWLSDPQKFSLVEKFQIFWCFTLLMWINKIFEYDMLILDLPFLLLVSPLRANPWNFKWLFISQSRAVLLLHVLLLSKLQSHYYI